MKNARCKGLVLPYCYQYHHHIILFLLQDVTMFSSCFLFLHWTKSISKHFLLLKQDAITIVKQQCSDFVMTRNIQCREMIDDVQRQISGLSFQDNKSSGSYSFPSTPQPHQTQRANSQQQQDPGNMPNPSHTQTPTYQLLQQQPQPAYAQTPPYVSQQQVPPPYHAPASSPYPPSQHQQPPASHEYGQPAYPGWQGPYYNAPPQQPGSMPRPPYTVQPPYPPSHQSGYYRQ